MRTTNLSDDFFNSKRRVRVLTLYRKFHYLANVKPLKAIPLARQSGNPRQWRERAIVGAAAGRRFSNNNQPLFLCLYENPLDLLFSLCRAKYFTEILEEFQECARVAAPTFCLDFWYIIDCVVRSCWLVVRSSVLWPATWHSWALFINRLKQPPKWYPLPKRSRRKSRTSSLSATQENKTCFCMENFKFIVFCSFILKNFSPILAVASFFFFSRGFWVFPPSAAYFSFS